MYDSGDIAAHYPAARALSPATWDVWTGVLERADRIPQKTCDSLIEFAERTRLCADSTLVRMPDAEYEACQQAIEAAARRESAPTPVIEIIELLSFTAGSRRGG